MPDPATVSFGLKEILTGLGLLIATILGWLTKRVFGSVTRTEFNETVKSLRDAHSESTKTITVRLDKLIDMKHGRED